MDDLRHDEVEELLGAYALDAVDDDERSAVDTHLATCPRCRAEVDRHREVASHLAQTGAPAPAELWDRIAESIAGDPPPPMRLVVGPRRSGRWLLAPLAAAAAAVIAVAAVAIADDEDRDPGLAELAVAAFAAPDALTGDLVDAGGTPLARVAVLPDGTGFVIADELPDLDAGTYQLWGTDGNEVVSLGVLGAAPEVVAFHAEPSQTTLMVTAEDAPVARSSEAAVAAGQLT